jgi:predicted aconitase
MAIQGSHAIYVESVEGAKSNRENVPAAEAIAILGEHEVDLMPGRG